MPVPARRARDLRVRGQMPGIICPPLLHVLAASAHQLWHLSDRTIGSPALQSDALVTLLPGSAGVPPAPFFLHRRPPPRSWPRWRLRRQSGRPPRSRVTK